MDDKIKKAVISHAQNDLANLPPERAKAEPVKEAGPKIGEGHLAAMARLGGKELTNALAAFPDSNIRPQEEMGVFGNTTPQVITQEIGHELSHDDRLAETARFRGGQDRDRSRSR